MNEIVGNLREYSVSELSGAVKRVIEDEFGFVRVRGELGRVTRAGSGHVYLDLKDDRAVISGVMWKGMAARLSIDPEQGMEVIATGKMSTFPGQSRYQLIIDTLEPAGVGALMALLEKRKKQFAAEGLFAAERKKPLPYLPELIGIVTSPSGAVIRDILHRLRERFPRRVIVWPTLVQGRGAEEKIAAAIRGFNALPTTGSLRRPDLLIVARGGGSLEDLWCFNEEAVVRAIAESAIPVISAVGHETDTTLADYAADKRAPTPTAAAEFAVPVRGELVAEILNKSRRLATTASTSMAARRNALVSAIRGLGRPDDITGAPQQRLDQAAYRLNASLGNYFDRRRLGAEKLFAKYNPRTLERALSVRGRELAGLGERQRRTVLESGRRLRLELDQAARGLLSTKPEQRLNRARRDFAMATTRLSQAAENSQRLRVGALRETGRLLDTLSYRSVLERGFVLARSSAGDVIRNVRDAMTCAEGRLQFHDGEIAVRFGGGGKHPDRLPKSAGGKPRQTRLFD